VLIPPQHHNWITSGAAGCTAICVWGHEFQEVGVCSRSDIVGC